MLILGGLSVTASLLGVLIFLETELMQTLDTSPVVCQALFVQLLLTCFMCHAGEHWS